MTGSIVSVALITSVRWKELPNSELSYHKVAQLNIIIIIIIIWHLCMLQQSITSIFMIAFSLSRQHWAYVNPNLINS